MNRSLYASGFIPKRQGELDQLPEDVPVGYKFFKLVGRRVEPVEDMMEWAKIFEDGSKRAVANTKIGDVTVSTVFLGLNHAWEANPPQIFETMIFGGEFSDHQWRTTTYAEAEKRHSEAIRLVNGEEINEI